MFDAQFETNIFSVIFLCFGIYRNGFLPREIGSPWGIRQYKDDWGLILRSWRTPTPTTVWCFLAHTRKLLPYCIPDNRTIYQVHRNCNRHVRTLWAYLQHTDTGFIKEDTKVKACGLFGTASSKTLTRQQNCTLDLPSTRTKYRSPFPKLKMQSLRPWH